MIKPALNSVELCYTPNDMKMVPENWMAPFGIIQFISKIRTCFIKDKYEGDAAVVLSSGFGPIGDFWNSKHFFVYSRSPYIDLNQKERGKVEFLERHIGNEQLQDLKGVGKVGERYAVVTEEAIIDQDYKAYGDLVDTAMKKWKVIDNRKGLQQPGMIISDTGELRFNFTEGWFTIDADKVNSFSGNINGTIDMGRFKIDIKNPKMTITVIPLDGKNNCNSEHMLMVAVGEMGNTDMKWEDNRLIDEGKPPVWIDQVQGEMRVSGNYTSCYVYTLDPNRLRNEKLPVKIMHEEVKIEINNEQGAIYYEIIIR